jgi:hypothetical protein
VPLNVRVGLPLKVSTPDTDVPHGRPTLVGSTRGNVVVVVDVVDVDVVVLVVVTIDVDVGAVSDVSVGDVDALDEQATTTRAVTALTSTRR